MSGSAKTNWPLLTLTSWVKGTSSFILPIIRFILIITIPPPTPPIVPIHADSASGWTSQSIVGSITLQLRDKQTKQKQIKYARTKNKSKNTQPWDGQVSPFFWTPSYVYLHRYAHCANMPPPPLGQIGLRQLWDYFGTIGRLFSDYLWRSRAKGTLSFNS